MIKSDLYKTGITLRFPRVETVRTDKSWYEILDEEELNKLFRVRKSYYIPNDVKLSSIFFPFILFIFYIFSLFLSTFSNIFVFYVIILLYIFGWLTYINVYFLI